MSVMEVSHRSKAFVAVAEEAEADLRALLAIPADYKVLFLQGGATGQFAAIPMNLTRPTPAPTTSTPAHGPRRRSARRERHCQVNVAADAAASRLQGRAAAERLEIDARGRLLHYTPNETIGGAEFPFVPRVDAPLVADMSSTIAVPADRCRRFGLIYAGAQKNIGPSGLCVVIVREDLIGRARAGHPAVWDFKAMAAEGSMLNTPPTFAWYCAGLVFKWLRARVASTPWRSATAPRRELLYRTIDESAASTAIRWAACRSWMNVPFTLADPSWIRPSSARRTPPG